MHFCLRHSTAKLTIFHVLAIILASPAVPTFSSLFSCKLKKTLLPLTERTTDAAHCLLETQPLITAVPLMKGTYSVEQEKGGKVTALISLGGKAQIDNDWQH